MDLNGFSENYSANYATAIYANYIRRSSFFFGSTLDHFRSFIIFVLYIHLTFLVVIKAFNYSRVVLLRVVVLVLIFSTFFCNIQYNPYGLGVYVSDSRDEMGFWNTHLSLHNTNLRQVDYVDVVFKGLVSKQKRNLTIA